ncbi:MAG: hypothetical protein Q4P24_17385, partial [Rhodobacterales bacterium]|nr:hypothetical protein [Rhodobacterales bacterium]
PIAAARPVLRAAAAPPFFSRLISQTRESLHRYHRKNNRRPPVSQGLGNFADRYCPLNAQFHGLGYRRESQR